MDLLTYEEVRGKRKNSKLIWIKEEKYLYLKKDERSDGTIVYLCYQNKINGNIECSARRSITPNGLVIKNAIPHSCHPNHESIYADLITRLNINESCAKAAAALDGLPVSVSNRLIFTRELAKYDHQVIKFKLKVATYKAPGHLLGTSVYFKDIQTFVH